MILQGVTEGTSELKNELVSLTSRIVSENVPRVINQFLPELIREQLRVVLSEFSKLISHKKQNVSMNEMVEAQLHKMARDAQEALMN